jgi:quinoprotein glucose dehydrogenase
MARKQRRLLTFAGAALCGLALWAAAPRLVSQAEPVAQPTPPVTAAQSDWVNYGNSRAGTRYSSLAQIDRVNVDALKRAWEVDFEQPPLPRGTNSQFESTPLKIGDTVFVCGTANIVHALDAETGARRWRFDPHVELRNVAQAACRGLAFYRQPQAEGECAQRILMNTVDGRLFALDARTGRRCAGFGKDGEVDLAEGLGPHTRNYYGVTSAPTIARDKVVVGGLVVDNQSVGEPSGVVRAFDAVTGRFAWSWDADDGTRQGPLAPGERFAPGTPNSWGAMSSDDALGLVYVPTGNATPDYFGGHRTPGSDRFASSVIALDAGTGALRWHFQTTHHDLWDYDVGSQPTLIDLRTPSGVRPALLQPTKRGQIFVLDRRTGKPIVPVVERAVPQGAVPGDHVSPTQPFPVGMPSFDGPPLTEASMWGLTPLDQLWCRLRFREARFDGPFTPPGLKRSLIYPGYSGGFNWGSVSVDPARRLLVVHWLRLATMLQLIPRSQADTQGMRQWNPIAGQPVRYNPQIGTPYGAEAKPFMSPLGVPCTNPPYGMIGAIDLDTLRVKWQRPLGTAQDAGPLGLRSGLPISMGTPISGGAVTTAGGLIFIGATTERAFRAIDSETGDILWKDRLHTSAHGSPISYWSAKSGRQFVLIAAGGSTTLKTPLRPKLIAYALPQPR